MIDGTGAAPIEDQTVLIADGKVQSIAPSTSPTVPNGAQMLDLKSVDMRANRFAIGHVVVLNVRGERAKSKVQSVKGRSEKLRVRGIIDVTSD